MPGAGATTLEGTLERIVFQNADTQWTVARVRPKAGGELAKRIVARFGLDTLEIVTTAPERLVEVEGIGRVRAARIRAGLEEQREVQDVMVFLQGHGVSTAFAVRIYKA